MAHVKKRFRREMKNIKLHIGREGKGQSQGLALDLSTTKNAFKAFKIKQSMFKPLVDFYK